MSNKITWADIYREFRSGHPKLRKNILYWQPNGYLSVLIRFKDGTNMTYDYLTKRCVFIRE